MSCICNIGASLINQGVWFDMKPDYLNTVEPLNNGASHFVLCRDVVHSSEVQNVLTIRGNEYL